MTTLALTTTTMATIVFVAQSNIEFVVIVVIGFLQLGRLKVIWRWFDTTFYAVCVPVTRARLLRGQLLRRIFVEMAPRGGRIRVSISDMRRFGTSSSRRGKIQFALTNGNGMKRVF